MKHLISVFTVVITTLLIVGCGGEKVCEEGSAAMTTEEMTSLMEKYVAFWNTGDFDGIEEVLHPEFVLRMTPNFEPIVGIEGFKQQVTYWRTTYPDFFLHINEHFFAGDKGAALWTISATNTGPGMYPPTGKHVVVSGMSIFHFKEGKLADEWIASNNLCWMLQMGYQIVPPGEGE